MSDLDRSLAALYLELPSTIADHHCALVREEIASLRADLVAAGAGDLSARLQEVRSERDQLRAERDAALIQSDQGRHNYRLADAQRDSLNDRCSEAESARDRAVAEAQRLREALTSPTLRRYDLEQTGRGYECDYSMVEQTGHNWAYGDWVKYEDVLAALAPTTGGDTL